MEVARRRCSCLSAVSCGVVWCRVYRVALEVCVDWCGRGCTAVRKERASVRSISYRLVQSNPEIKGCENSAGRPQIIAHN